MVDTSPSNMSRNNQVQNREFNEAVQGAIRDFILESQRNKGDVELTDDERQRLHQDVSGQNFSKADIQREALNMLRIKYNYRRGN